MGVLKVWDGATWRKGGCGGTAATTPDSFSIQSNHLAGSSSATPQFAYANVGSANVTLDVDWSASLVGSTAGVLLHYVDTSNFFVAARDGVYRMNGGAWSLVASYSGGATFGAGDHMQVAITTGGGFHPIVKKNGTQVAVLTVGGGGAIQTSSLNGFYCASDSTSRWDNWAASGCTTPSTDAFTGTDGDPLNPALWTVIPALTVATVGRLRLWTGTEWVREACDDDTPAGSGSFVFGLSDIRLWFPELDTGSPLTAPFTLSFEFRAEPTTGSISTFAVEWYDGASNHSLGSVTSAPGFSVGPAFSPWTAFSFDVTSVVGAGANYAHWYWITGGATGYVRRMKVTDAHGLIIYGEYPQGFDYDASIFNGIPGPGYDSLGSDGASTASQYAVAAPAGHPLKIEDPANPGTWITVACMVPV